MARRCTVCLHPDRPAIDQALVNRRPFRHLAAQFGLSIGALVRHHDDHIPAELAKAAEAAEVAQADDLLARVAAYRKLTEDILGEARGARDFRACAGLVGQLVRWETLLAEVERRIDRRPVLNVLVMPEWVQARTVLLEALSPYPEARAAVAARLLSLEAPR